MRTYSIQDTFRAGSACRSYTRKATVRAESREEAQEKYMEIIEETGRLSGTLVITAVPHGWEAAQ